MKISLIHPVPGPRRGFTLIELLTVIAIIGVLVAGSVGAYGKIVESVRKKKAQVMALTIANAVEQFVSDYNKLPIPQSGGGGGSDTDADTSQTDGLVQVLIGKEGNSDDRQNTRNIDYLDGFQQAKENPKKASALQGNTSEWIDGLVFEEGKYEVVDPWGSYFSIKLDLDYDGELENPNTDEASGGRTKLRKKVILWSPGKDMKEETWEDNVKSWE